MPLGVDDLMRSGGLLATYELLATPDTAHVPWAEMRQRLIADEYLEPDGTAVAGGFHAIVVAVDGADAGECVLPSAFGLTAATLEFGNRGGASPAAKKAKK